MENLILTTGNKNLVEIDHLQQTNSTNTTSCQSCVVKSATTIDVPTSTNVISNNPLIQTDNLLQETVNATSLKSSIFGSSPIIDFPSAGDVLSDKNCVINEEQSTQYVDSYTKEEIRDILSNYYTIDQTTEILNNIDLTTGEESTFYIHGLTLKEELPISETQISFTINDGIASERIFSLRAGNNLTLYGNSLFSLWFYLNGLSLSTTYNVKTILVTASGKNISEGNFILRPSRMYEMFAIPMTTNLLGKTVKLLNGELLYLTVSINKTTNFSETISITSGESNPSKLIINNNQLTSNNIFDYIEGIEYSQSKLNNSVIWENF